MAFITTTGNRGDQEGGIVYGELEARWNHQMEKISTRGRASIDPVRKPEDFGTIADFLFRPWKNL